MISASRPFVKTPARSGLRRGGYRIAHAGNTEQTPGRGSAAIEPRASPGGCQAPCKTNTNIGTSVSATRPKSR